MTKKLEKILSAVLMVVMMITIASNFVYADTMNPADLIGNSTFTGSGDIVNMGQSVIGLVQLVGTILSVVILVVIGIKYMMGSTEEKAEYKKTLIPYIVGAIVIFAASWLSGIVYNWASGLGGK